MARFHRYVQSWEEAPPWLEETISAPGHWEFVAHATNQPGWLPQTGGTSRGAGFDNFNRTRQVQRRQLQLRAPDCNRLRRDSGNQVLTMTVDDSRAPRAEVVKWIQEELRANWPASQPQVEATRVQNEFRIHLKDKRIVQQVLGTGSFSFKGRLAFVRRQLERDEEEQELFPIRLKVRRVADGTLISADEAQNVITELGHVIFVNHETDEVTVEVPVDRPLPTRIVQPGGEAYELEFTNMPRPERVSKTLARWTMWNTRNMETSPSALVRDCNTRNKTTSPSTSVRDNNTGNMQTTSPSTFVRDNNRNEQPAVMTEQTSTPLAPQVSQATPVGIPVEILQQVSIPTSLDNDPIAEQSFVTSFGSHYANNLVEDLAQLSKLLVSPVRRSSRSTTTPAFSTSLVSRTAPLERSWGGLASSTGLSFPPLPSTEQPPAPATVQELVDIIVKLDKKFDSKFGELDSKVTKLDEKMENRFKQMEDRFEQIYDRFIRLENKMDDQFVQLKNYVNVLYRLMQGQDGNVDKRLRAVEWKLVEQHVRAEVSTRHGESYQRRMVAKSILQLLDLFPSNLLVNSEGERSLSLIMSAQKVAEKFLTDNVPERFLAKLNELSPCMTETGKPILYKLRGMKEDLKKKLPDDDRRALVDEAINKLVFFYFCGKDERVTKLVSAEGPGLLFLLFAVDTSIIFPPGQRLFVPYVKLELDVRGSIELRAPNMVTVDVGEVNSNCFSSWMDDENGLTKAVRRLALRLRVLTWLIQETYLNGKTVEINKIDIHLYSCSAYSSNDKLGYFGYSTQLQQSSLPRFVSPFLIAGVPTTKNRNAEDAMSRNCKVSPRGKIDGLTASVEVF